MQIAAKDGRGGEGIQDYRLRLLPDPDNTAPVIISSPETKVTLSDEVYRYQLQSLDPDGDDLQYRLVESPLGTLIDFETGELLWFLNESVSVGETYNFTVEVRDGRGGIDTQTFQVEVVSDLGTIQGFVF